MIIEDHNIQANPPIIPEQDNSSSAESRTRKTLTESVVSSWSEAEQQKLRASELTGKMYRKSAKYTPLEPLDESPDSSWGEAAQAKLLESEREGKGYQQITNTQGIQRRE